MSGTLISVLTPVFNPDPQVLDATIASVVAQSYHRWQLCLVDDASTRPGVREVLERWTRRDARIRLALRETNGGISVASNDALALARGEFVALLDHDDLLHPDALGAVNHVLAHDPQVDAVYTDEDKVDEAGEHREAFHKPGWSPDYLTGCMYLGHLCAYRTLLVRSVGGFRIGLEGSQDWDLALRVTERARRVEHIRQVLYHWRISEQSVASHVSAKPYAVEAGRRAVEDHLARGGLEGWAEDAGHPGWFHLRRRLPEPEPLVSVLLPTAGSRRAVAADGAPELLAARCLRSLRTGTRYRRLEVICMVSPGAESGLEEQLAAAAGEVAIRFQRTAGPFNFSETINRAALHARGDLLLLLNDDTEALDPEWLHRLVEAVEDPNVGVAGAKLLYPDGRVQHAGVTHSHSGAPWHPNAGQPDGIGYFGELLLPLNYLAVTGACQLVRREVFEEVGGLDEGLPMNYNDIDFCLKTVSRGYRVVQVNAAVLRHYESATRPSSVTYQEMHTFVNRWAALSTADPFARFDLHPHG